jgi:hypothetical protein
MNELIKLSTIRSYRLKKDRGCSIWKTSACSEIAMFGKKQDKSNAKLSRIEVQTNKGTTKKT